MSSCVTEISEYPNIGCLVYENYAPVLTISKRYLGGKTTKVRNDQVQVTVLLQSLAEQESFLRWWVDDLNRGIGAFTILLPVLGGSKKLTVVLANDLAPVLDGSLVDTARISMSLKVIGAINSTLYISSLQLLSGNTSCEYGISGGCSISNTYRVNTAGVANGSVTYDWVVTNATITGGAGTKDIQVTTYGEATSTIVTVEVTVSDKDTSSTRSNTLTHTRTAEPLTFEMGIKSGTTPDFVAVGGTVYTVNIGGGWFALRSTDPISSLKFDNPSQLNSYMTEVVCTQATPDFTDLSEMFPASLTNLETIRFLNGFNIPNVTSTYRMIRSCPALTTVVLGDMTLSENTTMESFVYDIPATTPPDTALLDTAKVTTMSYAFAELSSITSPPNTSNFDTGLVTTMHSMFRYMNETLTAPDVSGFDTSGVTHLGYVFDGMRKVTTPPDVSGWVTSSATTMEFLFNNMNDITTPPDVSGFDTTEVTNIRSTFSGMYEITTPPDVSVWDTAKVTNMTSTFNSMHEITTPPDVSGWDTSAATTMEFLFTNMYKITTPPDVSGWDTAKVTNMRGMMRSWFAVGEVGDIGVETFNISSLTDATTFAENTTFATATYDKILINWEAQPHQSNVTAHFGNSIYSPAAQAARDALVADGWVITDGGSIYTLIIEWDTMSSGGGIYSDVDMEFSNDGGATWTTLPAGTNTYSQGTGGYILTTIHDITTFNFDDGMMIGGGTYNGTMKVTGGSTITSGQGMFYNMENLITLDLSDFSVPNLINTQQMFSYMRVITSLDLSGIPAGATNMNSMLQGCTDLTCITNLDTTAAGTTSEYIFSGCTSLVQPDAAAVTDLTDGDGAVWVNGSACP